MRLPAAFSARRKLLSPAIYGAANWAPRRAFQLGSILTYHVLPGQMGPDDVTGEQETLQGGTVEVDGDTDGMTVNGANVLCGNIPTANATVYVIDTVLMPS